MKKLWLTIVGVGMLMGCATNPAMPDKQATLITNIRIIDGKGTPAFDGAVRISDGVIQAVGVVTPDAGDFIVDGGGLILAPGFIDTHSHHDWNLFNNLSSAGAVSQGITTIIVGQDGFSSLPLEDFFSRLEDTPAALNIGSYSGHGSIRMAVMGNDFHRAATDDEIEAMASLVKADMAAGSLGLSTGLEYEAGVRSTTDEVVRLATVAGANGGRYISHLRSEDTYFWKALEEIIEIGEQAQLPVQVSHIKLAKVSSWGETDRLINRMNVAREFGVDITADIYPYSYWSSTIRVFFPDLDSDNPERANYAVTEVSTAEGIHLATWLPGCQTHLLKVKPWPKLPLCEATNLLAS